MTHEISFGRTQFSHVGVFTAKPTDMSESPAIIIVQEWWGVNAHIEDITKRFAREGFYGVAVDLYDGITTKDAKEAADLMNSLNFEKALDYLKTIVDHLRADHSVTSIGVTGFCMGGTFALRLPCETRLDAAVPFYGDVPEDTGFIKNLSCPVLFFRGGKDEWITAEKMNRLDSALKKYGKDGHIKTFEDADHAFFNDTRPEVFNKRDADDAWKSAIAFLHLHLP